MARFRDRRSAGRELAMAVSRLQLEAPLVLALPRGGVPVAWEVAQALATPLDLLLVRKLGVPGQPELGMGAITDGPNPRTVIDRALISSLGISDADLEQEIDRQRIELARRRRAYLGDRPQPDPGGRNVVLVDDGIATGGTVRVALDALRSNGAATVILAVSVAPIELLQPLQNLADEVICLSFPDPFLAVGRHYEQFEQTSDAEVVDLLARSSGEASHDAA